jgi:tripartite-type tricarboxylate transporter receptor subunit TctC
MKRNSVFSANASQLSSVALCCAAVLTAVFLSITTMSAMAQTNAAANFPERQVRIVVPFPAGGASDIVTRLFAKELGETWKQTVLVENKPGASGHLGGQYVANAKPDGHTLLIADMSTFTMSPALMPGLSYNPGKELTPVVIATFSPHILVVKNQLPVNTFDEFIAYAKAQKYPLTQGATLGTASHLAGVVMSQSLGFEINFIGYKGGAQVVSDLAGGQIDSTLNSFLATYGMVKAGNFKLLAVASPKRFSQIPETPAISERVPNFVTGSFQGMMTTAGTPPAIIEKINAEVQRIAATPEVQKRLVELGSEAVILSPKELQQWMVEQTAFWGKVIQQNNIKLQ